MPLTHFWFQLPLWRRTHHALWNSFHLKHPKLRFSDSRFFLLSPRLQPQSRGINGPDGPMGGPSTTSGRVSPQRTETGASISHQQMPPGSSPYGAAGIRVTTILVHQELKGILQCGNFSAKTRTVLGQPGKLVTLGLVDMKAPRTECRSPSALQWLGHSGRLVTEQWVVTGPGTRRPRKVEGGRLP